MRNFNEALVQRYERRANERMPLSASQHILYLLLTVFTGGLFLPFWIVRSIRGNLRPFAGDLYRR